MIPETLKKIQESLEQGTLSLTSIVETYLKRIEDTQDHNAYIEVFEDEAIEKARNLDDKLKSGDPLGKLFGLVISIKDNICYKGHKATAGSKMLSGFEAPFSATVVERLLAEDAIIIGRTNCDEFSMGSTNETSHYGPVLNALDKSKVAGGSSGGAAVSVKLKTCLAALGSDTGGSIRQPAAFNGVIGYKPSYGVVSRWGLIAYGSSFDQIGVLTEDLQVVNTIMNVISGPDDYDSTTLNHKIDFHSRTEVSNRKIVWFSNLVEGQGVTAELKSQIETYLNSLRDLGFEIIDKHFPFVDYLVPCYYILCTAEAASNLSRFDGIRYGHSSDQNQDDYRKWIMRNRTEGFGKEVKKRIILGNYVLSEGYYDAYYRQAQKVRRLIKAYLDEIFEEVPLVAMPVTASKAWDLGLSSKDPLQMYLSDIYTVLSNLAGTPSISLTINNNFKSEAFGIQLMAGNGMDEQLLSFCHYINKENKS